MKRHLLYILLLLFLMMSTAWLAGAATSIMKNTKHDLTSTSTASIHSTDTVTDICVFCHTPHSANTDGPLWNKTNPSNSYNKYDSDVLQTLTITAEDPLNMSNKAHAKTRICLSCHDGTIALGSLVNLPNDATGDYKMQGTSGASPQYAMPPSAAGYLGTDLSDDHPVAIKHISGASAGQDPELAASIPGNRVRLYDGTTGVKTTDGTIGAYVECTSCHDPHDKTYGNFLVETNQQSALCKRCHSNKIGFAMSAHDNNTINNATYQPPDGAGSTLANPGTKVGDVKCMNCHYPHRAGITSYGGSPVAGAGKYLPTYQEEKSCFNTTNRWNQATNVCHGTGGTNGSGKTLDIQTDVGRTSAHRVGDQNEKHGAVEVKSTTSNGWFNSSVWHVECEDCHNPHSAGTALHSKGTNTIDTVSPGSLYGVSYVRVSGAYPGGSWTSPMVYNGVEPLGATLTTSWAADVKEYEICFKCHSYFASGGGSFPNAPSNGLQMTDQSKEFNSTASYHPVAASNSNTYGAYVNGWTSGSQLMYCSDCHTKENNSQPKGSHGSTNPFILTKQYFDDKANWGSSDDSASTFCMDCHDSNTYTYGGTGTNTGFSGGGVNLHTQHALRAYNHISPSTLAYRCVNCHIRIPHGWQQRQGMIFVQGDTPGTMYAPVSGPTITSVNLPSPGGYASTTATKNTNCMTINGCHQQ